jgi:hypothetical protein
MAIERHTYSVKDNEIKNRIPHTVEKYSRPEIGKMVETLL